MKKSLNNIVIILDRDGIINVDREDYVKSPDEFIPIYRTYYAMGILSANGIPICVASNQRGVGLGKMTSDDLMAVNNYMIDTASKIPATFDRIMYATNADRTHEMVKPNPGMINKIKSEYDEGTEFYFVGDNLTDVQCAINAGVIPVFIKDEISKDHEEYLLRNSDKGILRYCDVLSFIHELVYETKIEDPMNL